jgi:hypothetical protein
MTRMLSRILLTLFALATGSFLLLVTIGLWTRYEGETGALDLRGSTREARNARVAAAASLHQHIPKLVGSGAPASANQGTSVGLSANGKIAVLGGPGPNNADRDRSSSIAPAGAAWVFTRSGSGWTQQGDKLIGTTNDYGGGLWSQGASVAVSADGNTAIVGGPSDNRTTGAAWVFARSDGAWTQQGNKLVGSGASTQGEPPASVGQGMSVALSADGNTAIVGAWRAEGAWVFIRRDGVWIQQGKLVGSGAVGSARQGISVALAADGNTAILGGWSDNNKTGATWVFTRSKGVWTQQGKKLVGSGAIGHARQGASVALSSDGNTAIIGGPGDNPSDRFGAGAAGAAWVFTRHGGAWAQEGQKLVANRGVWTQQGTSVALSADGNVAVVGGFANDHHAGGAAVYTRKGAEWTQESELAGHSGVGKSAPPVAISADASTVLLGEPDDNGGRGAALVFTRRSAGDY